MKMLLDSIRLAAVLGAGLGASVEAGSHTPGHYWDFVMPHGEAVYFETFEGDFNASIVLDGDCFSDIDLWVYDEYRNLIAKSTSYGCQERVDFTPLWTGEFMIVVENHGKPNGSNFVLTTY